MVKVYAVVLSLATVALVVVLMGSNLFQNLNQPGKDPNQRLSTSGKMALGSALGFGMGGMAAEFSPLDLGWPVAFLLAIAGGALGALWIRYAVRMTTDS
jgi:hypothetical protein